MLAGMFTRAILRRPGADFALGLTTSAAAAPQFARMLEQHAAYAAALQVLGLQLEVLEPLAGFPDAYFVEDVAVVVPEVAIVTRPGAPSRREEAAAIGAVLARHRRLSRIEPPGTLEGGDVLIVDKAVWVGQSARTNAEGAAQLGHLLAPHGYEVITVPVAAGLHFKSSVSHVGGDALLTSGQFADLPALRGKRLITADADEVQACNSLFVNGTLLMPAGCPKTRRKLAELGHPIVELDVSEAAKMDGGLTCMSLRL